MTYSVASRLLDSVQQLLADVLGVTQEHAGVALEENGVLQKASQHQG